MNNQLYKDIIKHRFCKGENDMANYYRVAYTESDEVLKKICELFDVDSSDITIKVVVAILGPLVFWFMYDYGNPGGGTTGGMILFILKFIALWALAFAAAVVLNRTIWRKALEATAAGQADEQFKKRCKLYGGPVKAEIRFYDDHFESIVGEKTKAYTYDKVTKILQTKEAFGVAVKDDMGAMGNARSMYGFPKEALEGGDVDGLAEFLLARCSNMRRKKVKKF